MAAQDDARYSLAVAREQIARLEREAESFVTRETLELTLKPVLDRMASVAKVGWFIFAALLTGIFTYLGTLALQR